MKINHIYQGNVLDRIKDVEENSIQCVVTSPPYWGLRDYGTDEQLGLEETPEEFIENMVKVFRGVKKVLKDDGTLWLNLGDSYSQTKNKQLLGIPWRVALALQQDGWYLRQDIIWHKPNPMPESVQDRCTKAHEYIFLLSKSPQYYYDKDAIAEKSLEYGKDKRSDKGNIRYEGKRTSDVLHKNLQYKGQTPHSVQISRTNGQQSFVTINETRNKRSVWAINTKPYKEAHFAVFPEKLPELCIKAGSKEGDIVLDPFFGSGTTGWVAQRLGRKWLGIELNPEFIKIANKRFTQQELFI